MKTIQISQKPTFDLDEIEFISYSDGILYVRSKKVMRFDFVTCITQNRSRVLRPEKQESHLCKTVIAAVTDAGFTGTLCWKIELTQKGIDFVKSRITNNTIPEIETAFSGCQQLYFTPCERNYYNGSNQTTLTPDIIFTI